MKNTHQSVSTARGVAALRAIDSARPAGQRLFSDPHARAFVRPSTLFLFGLFLRTGLYDRLLFGGMINFAVAREQYIFELMQHEVADGAGQVVILGAGFDTRAYRLQDAGALAIFEVDHPTTQAAKRAALGRLPEAPPAGLRFVPVDFDADSLEDRLLAAGYDPTRRTVFVWQGVTMYLSLEGINRTLGFVMKHSGPRSLVVFDYIFRDAMKHATTAAARFMTRAIGERVTFSLDEAEVESFLRARGFGEIVNVDGPELSSRYFTGRNAGRTVTRVAGIVYGRTPSPR